MESNRYASECLARTLSGEEAIFSAVPDVAVWFLSPLVSRLPSFSLISFRLSQKLESLFLDFGKKREQGMKKTP
jgi:hypothetical protein